MKRNVMLVASALLLGPVALLVLAAQQQPNVVFLFADDLAANAVGYSGNKDVITPNIDKLARDGVRFTNHYNTTSICMASRAA